MATANSASTGPTTLPTPAHSVTGSVSQSDMAMADDSPHKRKRPLDDIGERDQKKVQYDYKLGIEDLHLDVGEKYLLLKKRKKPICCTFSALPLVEMEASAAWQSFYSEEYLC